MKRKVIVFVYDTWFKIAHFSMQFRTSRKLRIIRNVYNMIWCHSINEWSWFKKTFAVLHVIAPPPWFNSKHLLSLINVILLKYFELVDQSDGSSHISTFLRRKSKRTLRAFQSRCCIYVLKNYCKPNITSRGRFKKLLKYSIVSLICADSIWPTHAIPRTILIMQ